MFRALRPRADHLFFKNAMLSLMAGGTDEP
jgi:hypothetical protein